MFGIRRKLVLNLTLIVSIFQPGGVGLNIVTAFSDTANQPSTSCYRQVGTRCLAYSFNVTVYRKSIQLTRKLLGFEQTYMYEILVTGTLSGSECAGECRLSANLCKRVLDVPGDVIVEATRNADMLAINASEDFQ